MVKKIEMPFSELHKIAVRVAKNIHLCDDVEHGRTIDKYGEIRKFSGDLDGVYIDVVQDTRIIVHNHPHKYKISNTFSYEDIYRFLTKKYLCEIIVSSYGYYYILRRGTYKGLSLEISNHAKELYFEIKDKVIKECSQNPDNRNLPLRTIRKKTNAALELEYHKALKEFLTGKGLSYERCKI